MNGIRRLVVVERDFPAEAQVLPYPLATLCSVLLEGYEMAIVRRHPSWSLLCVVTVLTGIGVGYLRHPEPVQAARLSLSDLQAQITELSTLIAPVGAIVAWHADMPGTPGLPDGWVSCNGGTVADPLSPLNGGNIPNLNTDGRFLRGGLVSGAMQDDAMQTHTHSIAHTHPYEDSHSWKDGIDR